jgi:hypothetical protein
MWSTSPTTLTYGINAMQTLSARWDVVANHTTPAALTMPEACQWHCHGVFAPLSDAAQPPGRFHLATIARGKMYLERDLLLGRGEAFRMQHAAAVHVNKGRTCSCWRLRDGDQSLSRLLSASPGAPCDSQAA